MNTLNDSTFFILICAVLGLVVGSFLNVVILRLPIMMEQAWHRECCDLLEQHRPDTTPISLSHPGSRCPICGTAIKALAQHPRDQLASIARAMRILQGPHLCPLSIDRTLNWHSVRINRLAVWFRRRGMSALVLIWMLIALTGIDIDTQLLPDSLTLPLLWLGLGVNLFAIWTPLSSAVIGAMLGYGILWTIYWLFKLVTGKEGMGYGDFKLLSALGAWFGWQEIPLIILLSSLAGAIGLRDSADKRSGARYSYALRPLFAGAGLVMLFFGDTAN